MGVRSFVNWAHSPGHDSNRPVEIDILTLFPAMGDGLLNESMLRIAREKGLVDIRLRNLREWAPDKHHVTD